MFARMRFVSAFLSATVMFQAGCQSPGDLRPDGSQNQAPGDPKQLTGDEIGTAKIEARTFIAAGRLHESQNRLMDAVQQYQHALAEDPGNVEILCRIGLLYDQIGNGALAEKAYQDALRRAPDDARIHNNLAFSYILRHKWPEAGIALTRALELAPDFARARVNLGMVLAQQNRFDEALQQFQTVLPPEDAFYDIGLMYQSKRKLVEAAASYKRSLEANPKLTAAKQQLKRMSSDVLAAADRKLREEQEAASRLAASPPEPETELVDAEVSATRPAEEGDDAAAPEVSGEFFDQPISETADSDPVSTPLTVVDPSFIRTETQPPTSQPGAEEPADGQPPVMFGDGADDLFGASVIGPPVWIPEVAVDRSFIRMNTELPESRPADTTGWDELDAEDPLSSMWRSPRVDVPPIETPDVVVDRSFIRMNTDLPATRPAEDGMTWDDRVLTFDYWVMSELESLLTAWQRSPELLSQLAADPWIVSPINDGYAWSDRQESPAASQPCEPEITIQAAQPDASVVPN